MRRSSQREREHTEKNETQEITVNNFEDFRGKNSLIYSEIENILSLKKNVLVKTLKKMFR